MIKFNEVSVKYNQKTILTGFNLDINEGEKVLIRGASGKGKSSLLKALLGFVPLDQGFIEVAGIILSEKDIQNIRKKIAYVSQDVDLMAMTAKLYIEEIFNYKLNRLMIFDDKKLYELFDFFEMDKELLEKNIIDFSGGERQRLGLIIALLLDREILLLDEVTAGLEKALKQKVFDFIISMPTTSIIVSHDDIWVDDRIRVVNI
jgi:putative ABC transport system ATP-binding protein